MDCGGAYAECKKLNVGVLVPQPPFEGTHGILWLRGLGAYLVAYLEVEGDVLGAAWEELGGRLVWIAGVSRCKDMRTEDIPTASSSWEVPQRSELR